MRRLAILPFALARRRDRLGIGPWAGVLLLVGSAVGQVGSVSSSRAFEQVEWAPAGEPALLPTGFELERVGWGPFISGNPVGFALLPDGRVLMVERNTGNVRLNAVGASSSVAIHTVPDVNATGGEQGLLGVCVDPEWPTRPYLYFYYNHVGGTVYVTMFAAQGELTDPFSTVLTLGTPYHLLIDIPDNSELHQAGTLRFGPDGMLYVSTGDDGNPCNAQDLAVLAGKILRLDVSTMPGVGSGPPAKGELSPPDNPFSGPGENERLVWAWGLRNPFRFTVDPANGDVFIGDVGRIDYEEVDQIPYSGGGGENFGWPQREGPIDPDLGFTCGIENTFTDPIIAYPRPVAFAVIGGPRYRTPSNGSSAFHYPPEYEGSLFALDFYGGWWKRYVEGPSGWELAAPVDGQPSPENWAEGLHYCSDVQLGPDGALYYNRLLSPAEMQGVFRIVPESPVSAEALAPVRDLLVAPNPARVAQDTRFSWSSPQGGECVLRIYDAAGRRVRLVKATRAAPWQELTWDGTDAYGRPVPAGIYLFELETPDGGREIGKVTRFR